MFFTLWLALPILAAMIVCAWQAWVGQPWAAVVLVLLAVSWLRINKNLEGPLLLGLGDDHGLVLSDLVAVVAVAGAAAAYWRHRWTQRSLVS